MTTGEPGWPSAAFGIALLVLIATIMITAIRKYDDVEHVIKIWALLGTLTGAVVGAAGGYFFRAPQVSQARAEAQDAVATLQNTRREMSEIRKLVETTSLHRIASAEPPDVAEAWSRIIGSSPTTRPVDLTKDIKSLTFRIDRLTADLDRHLEHFSVRPE